MRNNELECAVPGLKEAIYYDPKVNKIKIDNSPYNYGDVLEPRFAMYFLAQALTGWIYIGEVD